MGFFGAIGAIGAALGGKSKNSSQSDTSKPFHTHGGDSPSGGGTATASQNQTYEPLSDGGGQQAPVFMGKNEVDNFSSLTDPSSVDRGGRTILPGGRPETGDPISNVPTSPAPELGQNPIPVPNAGVDETGVNSLY